MPALEIIYLYYLYGVAVAFIIIVFFGFIPMSKEGFPITIVDIFNGVGFATFSWLFVLAFAFSRLALFLKALLSVRVHKVRGKE